MTKNERVYNFILMTTLEASMISINIVIKSEIQYRGLLTRILAIS